MRYRFTNQKGQSFAWENIAYPRVLELAERYGWKPRGTTPAWWLIEKMSHYNHPEEYHNRPVVSADDAAEMARALDQAMADISEYKRNRDQDPSYSKPNYPDGWPGYDLGLYHDDKSEWYDYWISYYDELGRFIQFLRAGCYYLS